MTFGARPFGTRTFGDGAPSDPIIASGEIEEIFAEVSFEGSGSISFGTTTSASIAFTGTAEFDANAAIAVEWSRIEFTGTGTFNVTPPFSGTRRRVIVTDYEGNPIAELEEANISPITFELNRPETWSFTLPSDHPKVSAIVEEHVREVQLWRGDQLLSWGPMTRPSISGSEVSVSVTGALWHLGRRHIGKAERTNYVKNGDFEDGLARWGFFTSPIQIAYDLPGKQLTPPIHSIVNFPTVAGKRSLRLQNYVTEADAWASQSFEWVVNTTTSPDGDQWTLVGYVFVSSFTGPASESRGLYIERLSTTELDPRPEIQAVIPGAMKSIQRSFVPINEETPRGVWNRMEIGLETPPKAGEPETVQVRLYAPNGTVFWDRISLTLDERTGFYGTDQAIIAKKLVEHLQDAAYDKSDVNISTDCQPTGILRDRIYYHSEHPNGLRSIEEFTSLSDGFDISVVYTPTDRIFQTHFPQKGRHLPKFALETKRNISTFAWVFDGEAASTSVIVLGTGNGSGREEGSAIDTGHFAGLTLEEVFVAPPDTKIDSLDNIAKERLITTVAPEVLTVRTTPPKGRQVDPIGILEVGDTVPVRIEQGTVLIDGTYRITRMSINPDDTLELVLNRRTLQL